MPPDNETARGEHTRLSSDELAPPSPERMPAPSGPSSLPLPSSSELLASPACLMRRTTFFTFRRTLWPSRFAAPGVCFAESVQSRSCFSCTGTETCLPCTLPSAERFCRRPFAASQVDNAGHTP